MDAVPKSAPTPSAPAAEPEHKGPPPSASILASRTRIAASKSRATVLIVANVFTPALRATLKSALDQSEPIDIYVVDDAGTDSLGANVRAAFPAVKVARNDTAIGPFESRNKAAALLTTPIIITLDVGAVFTSRDAAHQLLADFDHPRVAVVAAQLDPAIPAPSSSQTAKPEVAPPGVRAVTPSFNAGACAMRLDIFRAIGRYRPYLSGHGEESDLGIRLLDAGYICRAARVPGLLRRSTEPAVPPATPSSKSASPPPTLTPFSPREGARNSILFAWHNVPSPALYFHWFRTSLRLLRAGMKSGSVGKVISGIWSGMRSIKHHRSARAPVAKSTFKLFRHLNAAGELPYADVEPDLGTPRAI